jgi:hypothetical protein
MGIQVENQGRKWGIFLAIVMFLRPYSAQEWLPTLTNLREISSKAGPLNLDPSTCQESLKGTHLFEPHTSQIFMIAKLQSLSIMISMKCGRHGVVNVGWLTEVVNTVPTPQRHRWLLVRSCLVYQKGLCQGGLREECEKELPRAYFMGKRNRVPYGYEDWRHGRRREMVV